MEVGYPLGWLRPVAVSGVRAGDAIYRNRVLRWQSLQRLR